jgi:hypothetical protein
MAIVTEEEWPEIIGDEDTHDEYGRVSEAVGELTSAILDCKFKKLMDPNIVKQLRNFLTGAIQTLDEGEQ